MYRVLLRKENSYSLKKRQYRQEIKVLNNNSEQTKTTASPRSHKVRDAVVSLLETLSPIATLIAKVIEVFSKNSNSD